jgi:hypothetical protein
MKLLKLICLLFMFINTLALIIGGSYDFQRILENDGYLIKTGRVNFLEDKLTLCFDDELDDYDPLLFLLNSQHIKQPSSGVLDKNYAIRVKSFDLLQKDKEKSLIPNLTQLQRTSSEQHQNNIAQTFKINKNDENGLAEVYLRPRRNSELKKVRWEEIEPLQHPPEGTERIGNKIQESLPGRHRSSSLINSKIPEQLGNINSICLNFAYSKLIQLSHLRSKNVNLLIIGNSYFSVQIDNSELQIEQNYKKALNLKHYYDIPHVSTIILKTLDEKKEQDPPIYHTKKLKASFIGFEIDFKDFYIDRSLGKVRDLKTNKVDKLDNLCKNLNQGQDKHCSIMPYIYSDILYKRFNFSVQNNAFDSFSIEKKDQSTYSFYISISPLEGKTYPSILFQIKDVNVEFTRTKLFLESKEAHSIIKKLGYFTGEGLSYSEIPVT